MDWNRNFKWVTSRFTRRISCQSYSSNGVTCPRAVGIASGDARPKRRRSSLLFYFLFVFLFFPHPVFAVNGATESASMSVSARVNPRPTDFQFDFTSSVTGSVVGAEEEIEYTITYGSTLSYPTQMTITASWSQAAIPDAPQFVYDLVTYVAGSATKDYWGQSTPVVDVKNRTITWTIRRFPPNTIDKTLRFKLRTPSRYVTDRSLDFHVDASFRTEQIGVGDKRLDFTYSPTEFIRREVAGLRITALDIRRITDSSFTLFLTTSQPARTVITYGTDPENLDGTLTDNELTDQKLITVPGLKPATTYYFRVLIENDKGIQRRTPELLQVTTGATSLITLLDAERVMMSVDGILLGLIDPGGDRDVFVPQGKTVTVYLPFLTQTPASLFLRIVPSNVLGIASDGPIPPMEKIRLLETQPDVYSGQLAVPTTTGRYDVLIEGYTQEGDVSEDVLAPLVVTTPIRITAIDGRGIEAAYVYIERYNTISKRFEILPAQTYGQHNPIYSDIDGSISLVLPAGEYSINVNAIGHKPYQNRFVIGTTDVVYPTIVLEDEPFRFLSYVRYYTSIAYDSWSFVLAGMDELASSYRFLDMSLLIAATLLSVFGLFLTLHRLKLSLEALLLLIEKRLLWVWRGKRDVTLFLGAIEDDTTGLPVHGAVVLLVQAGTKNVIARDVTNLAGQFQFHLALGALYDLYIRKPGFVHFHEKVGAEALFAQHPPFVLHRIDAIRLPGILDFIALLFRSMLAGLSTTIFFTVVAFHAILVMRVGIVPVLPMAIVTGITIGLWVDLEWQQWKAHQKVQKERVSA